jgi:flavin-dependent dehydrogenase
VGNAQDVLIVGAGPAGSVAALVLARAGVRVRLMDRARFPRHKLCGDTVNPGTMTILDRLGLSVVTDPALLVDGMIVTDASGVRCIGRYGSGRHGRSLQRSTFDAALLDRAVAAGAQFEEGALVRQPLVRDGRVRGVTVAGYDGGSRQLTAPVVIAADGASSRLGRALGLSRYPLRPRRWAVGAYFHGVRAEETGGCFGEMHLREGRYLGIAPLPAGVTNACVVTDDRKALRDPVALLLDTVSRDALVAHRFAGAELMARPVCLGPLAVEASGSGVPGLLLAGDAAGFVDPMTGDGLRFAIRGGELAAMSALEMLEHGAHDVHTALWAVRRREFAAKWRFNRTLRALVGSPAAMRVAAAGARRSPALIEHVIRYAGDARL